MKIDVIIPTYRPGRKFLELMKRLTSQSVKADRIIIMNTEEKYFDGLLYGTDFAREYPEAEVHHLSKESMTTAEPGILPRQKALRICSCA